MGCFPIHQGHHKAKHSRSSPSPSSSLGHPSLKILRELKLGSFPSHVNSGYCNSSSISRIRSTRYPGTRQGPGIPCTRARAVLHNASAKLVSHHPRALSLSSSSFSKAQQHCAQNRGEGTSCHGYGEGSSIISYSAPMPSPAMEDEERISNAHLFPLPLPPTATPASTGSEDSSSQFVSSTGSGSSSSSSSSVPFSACSVSTFSHNFKSYNNPLGSHLTTENNPPESKVPTPLPSLAQPLPLPPVSNIGAPLREFSYDELAGACLNFAPEFFIRYGGAGCVFRATVGRNLDEEGAMDIAVTRLSRGHSHSYKKWRAEVGCLARFSHPNICKVLGFSREDPSTAPDKLTGLQRERLLVYEHTSNGSLESLLYCRKGRAPLDWATRCKIALGAAQGLAFLHDRTPRQIIYECFKTLNVQVDQSFNAKLSDYGFARSTRELPSCSPARSLTSDHAYAAPETQSRNEVSAKSNVWSFGIVLLELLTGRQNMDDFFVPEERNLLQWCRPYLLDPKRLYLVMDPELKGRYSTQKAKMVADLALQCLIEDPVARPSMRDIATSLLLHMPTSNQVVSKADQASAFNSIHSNGSHSSMKLRYPKSYNLASILASPARTFTPSSHSPNYSPAHNSRTRFKGFLSGEITREASHSLAGCRGDHPFLSRSGFLSGEIAVCAAEPHRSPSSKDDFGPPLGRSISTYS
eukprot:c21148_g2_i1 orf=266-2347(+)